MNLTEIKDILLNKSATKQQVYSETLKCFANLKHIALAIADNLAKEIENANKLVKVAFYDKGEFEFHLKFSGDTLVFMMHTNVFSFQPNHYTFQSDYVKQDENRKFCGMIQVYNLLSDSLKYNRESDLGYLIARIFINKDNHFIIEGKRNLALKYNNFECCTINDKTLHEVVIEAMVFCLNFDLLAPSLDMLQLLTVEQKNHQSYSSGMPTGKRLGFTMQSDKEVE